MAVHFQAMITIAIVITMILEHLKPCIQEITKIMRKATHAVKSVITKISHNNHTQKTRKTHRAAALVITS